MKKILLSLLIILGLQTKAQINWCDSISYTTLSQQTLTVIGNSSLSPNMVDSIIWSWQACNSTLCYSGSGDTASFINILTTDTVKVCYDAYIYFMGVSKTRTKLSKQDLLLSAQIRDGIAAFVHVCFIDSLL